MSTPYTITRLLEFERDLKALEKRYRTLSEDLKVLIASQIQIYHEHGVDNGGIHQLQNLEGVDVPVYKVTKFACRALKGRGAKTGLRLIYAFFEAEGRIELIELYFKSDQVNEDRERIKRRYRGST